MSPRRGRRSRRCPSRGLRPTGARRGLFPGPRRRRRTPRMPNIDLHLGDQALAHLTGTHETDLEDLATIVSGFENWKQHHVPPATIDIVLPTARIGASTAGRLTSPGSSGSVSPLNLTTRWPRSAEVLVGDGAYARHGELADRRSRTVSPTSTGSARSASAVMMANSWSSSGASGTKEHEDPLRGELGCHLADDSHRGLVLDSWKVRLGTRRGGPPLSDSTSLDHFDVGDSAYSGHEVLLVDEPHQSGPDGLAPCTSTVSTPFIG